MRDGIMAEFKMVAIIGRRFRNGREEVQVQWAVTWEPVDEAFAEGQLYKEYMEDLEAETESPGNEKTRFEPKYSDKLTGVDAEAKGEEINDETDKNKAPTTGETAGEKRPRGEGVRRSPRGKGE